MNRDDVLRETLEAEQRIRSFVRKTPLEYNRFLSSITQCNVYLKLENFQETGSFKVRGAFNSLLSLSDKEKKAGIITASTGNHGIAVSYAQEKLDIIGKIYVPTNISKTKLDILKLYNADLSFYGTDTGITETFARKQAAAYGQRYISPYNDPRVIGGQGTIGYELAREVDHIDAVFIPVGGGGLAAGIAGFLKSTQNQIKIIGCQPEQSPVMFESIKAGRIIDMESGPTLADGTAGRIESGTLTFSICQDCLDEFVLVSEEEIKNSIRLTIQQLNMLIEGAAALSLAAFLQVKNDYRGKNIVIILSGKRLSFETLRSIICG